jgi:hypothetical protein
MPKQTEHKNVDSFLKEKTHLSNSAPKFLGQNLTCWAHIHGLLATTYSPRLMEAGPSVAVHP